MLNLRRKEIFVFEFKTKKTLVLLFENEEIILKKVSGTWSGEWWAVLLWNYK